MTKKPTLVGGLLFAGLAVMPFPATYARSKPTSPDALANFDLAARVEVRGADRMRAETAAVGCEVDVARLQVANEES